MAPRLYLTSSSRRNSALNLANVNMILHHYRALYARHNTGLTQAELSRQVEIARCHLQGYIGTWVAPLGGPPPTDRLPPSAWASALAMRVVWSNAQINAMWMDNNTSQFWTEDHSRARAIAYQLEDLRPSQEARIAGRQRLRKLLSILVTNAMMVKKHVAFPDHFPREDTSQVRRCRLRRGLLPPATTHDRAPSNNSNHETVLGSDDNTSAIPTIPRVTELRQGQQAEQRAMRAEDQTAITEAGYSNMTRGIMELAASMEKLVTVNLDAFIGFYAQKGMLTGSGEPTEEELAESRRWQHEMAREFSFELLWADPGYLYNSQAVNTSRGIGHL